jgi:membrane protease YdiL (CAAX protease family)
MYRNRIPGSLKAGYIFSLMPHAIRAFLMNRFSPREQEKLDNALQHLNTIPLASRRAILQECISRLEDLRKRREQQLESSLIISLTVIAVLVISSFIYAHLVLHTSSRILQFIDAVLSNGGMHLIVFPFLWGIVRTEYQRNPLQIVFSSQNLLSDASVSVVAAFTLALLLMEPGTSGTALPPVVLRTFIIVMALTVGPLTEEIFFRFFLFLQSGRRYGYLFCGMVSSLLFAAVHLPGSFLIFLKYLLCGALLCGICYFRKSVFPAFCAHAMANLILIIV